MAPLLPPDRPARPPTRIDHLLVAAVALAAALGACASAAEPAGWLPADLFWRAGIAVLAVVCGARAHRWTWLVAAAVGAAAAPDLATAAPAVLGLAIALVTAAFGRRTRLVGALVLGLAVQSLLRLDMAEPAGLASLVAAAGLLPAMGSAYGRSRRTTRRIVKATVLGMAVLSLGLAVGQALAVLDARSSVEAGIDYAQAGFDAARDGEEDAAVEQFLLAASEFDEANAALKVPWAVAGRAVPVLGLHARAMVDITSAGASLTDIAASATSDAPLDELQFRDGVIDLAQVAQFVEPLDRADTALREADETVAEVDSPWLVAPLADRVQDFADEVDEARPQAELARRGVEVAPGLFGGEGVRRYFIAFTTPAEQRGLGGFMGNFGILTARDGDLELTRSDEISALERLTRANHVEVTAPPDYVERYGSFDPGLSPGDITLSPDMPSVSTVIAQFYRDAGLGEIDGVILVDPYALQALLNFTGPIEVEGSEVPLTSENAADILLREQYITFDDRASRKDFLEEASRKTFEALTSGDIPGPRRVTEVLGPMVDQGRLLIHSFDEDEQAFFAQAGLDGVFPSPEGGDLLGVTTQNSSHNKGDTFLQRQVRYDATIDPQDGTIDAIATVTLVNSAPPGGLPDVFIGNNGTAEFPDLPPGTNRMYLSLYSPLTLVEARRGNQALPVDPGHELGVNVYSRFVVVGPGETATFTFHLVGAIDLQDDYRFTYAAQATANPDRVRVHVTTTDGWRLDPDGTFALGREGVQTHWTDAEDHVLHTDIHGD
jgi:Protein of unknown function (DUF4012)